MLPQRQGYAGWWLVLASYSGTLESTPAHTPDIEAIVQARLKEERAAEATVEAKAQAVANQWLQATAQAMPRATLTASVSETTMAFVEDGELSEPRSLIWGMSD